MKLLLLMVLLFGGGALAAVVSTWSRNIPRWVALAALLACLPTLIDLLFTPGAPWRDQLQMNWIPAFGISLHLAADGLAVTLIALTVVLGIVAVLVSWDIRERPGSFFLNLLWVLAGTIGVFSAMDLFLFFVFWEVMLLPMFLLIALWGYEGRLAAAMKFFLFTQASGLLLLAAIIAVVWFSFRSTGRLSFDYFDLLGRDFGSATGWLMSGFLLAFAVKLPVVPVHTWLADAHTQAPTAASVILAGVMLKTGAYGIWRFVLPLFPGAAYDVAPAAMALGVVGILYGGLLAFGQRDLKRLVAYSSVSHMGFVLLGLFAFTPQARSGVLLQLVAHGLSTGALFVVVGALQARLHSRDVASMGGLWSTVPRLSAFGMLFAIASLGLPGLANFVAEFLILLGAFAAAPGWTMLAALGLVIAAVYSLSLVQRAFHGSGHGGGPQGSLLDASLREMAVLSLLAIGLIGFGLWPQPLLDMLELPAPTELVLR